MILAPGLRGTWSRAAAFPAALRRIALIAALLAAAAAGGPVLAQAQAEDAAAPAADPALPPVVSMRTDNPRQTLSTVIRLRENLETLLRAYRAQKTTARAERFVFVLDQLIYLIDLSEVPTATRREVGVDTVAALLDVFGRIELPNLDDVPDASAFDDAETARFRIPRTPISIMRVEEGPRAGEYLFGAATNVVAPRFLVGVRNVPMRTEVFGLESWSDQVAQLTGPLIPSRLDAAIPERLKREWMDTPLWKVLAVGLTAVIACIALGLLHRLLQRTEPPKRIWALSWRSLRPFALLFIVWLLIPFFAFQLNLSGAFSAVVDGVTIGLIYVALAWLFWLGVRLFFEWIIMSPQIADESLDANLLRLVGGSVAVVGVVIIIAYGGQALGLPLLSVLAGLGVGGLAVALAIRPTLENLIGGIILYVDRPVRVGDFCTYGAKFGQVEEIGIRSAKIRALDRTLISVPNAQFADMEIINWTQCDRMLIQETIGVRYETTLAQMEALLEALRDAMLAHPRLDHETVRVRFDGFGDSSQNISVRVYAWTHGWNDYYEVRESVLLRIARTVEETGASFAFPSRTVYIERPED